MECVRTYFMYEISSNYTHIVQNILTKSFNKLLPEMSRNLITVKYS